MLCKKGVPKLSQNSKENTCVSAFFNTFLILTFIIKESLVQVLSFQFWEIFKSTPGGCLRSVVIKRSKFQNKSNKMKPLGLKIYKTQRNYAADLNKQGEFELFSNRDCNWDNKRFCYNAAKAIFLMSIAEWTLSSIY